MKRNRDVIFTCFVLLTAIVLTACDLFGQSSTTLARPCTGFGATPKKATVEIDKEGDISIVPCNGRSVLIGGNSPGSFISSINGQTALSQTFAPPAASDTASWFSNGGVHTLRLPITGVTGSNRVGWLPVFQKDNVLTKSRLQQNPFNGAFEFYDAAGMFNFQLNPEEGTAYIGRDSTLLTIDAPSKTSSLYGRNINLFGLEYGFGLRINDAEQTTTLGGSEFDFSSARIKTGPSLIELYYRPGGQLIIGDNDTGAVFDADGFHTTGPGLVNFSAAAELSVSQIHTPAGTTGNQTLNETISGSVNFAAGAGLGGITVTNSRVQPTSIVLAVARSDDATCSVKSVVPTWNSFVIKMTANCTAETSVGFIVLNGDR